MIYTDMIINVEYETYQVETPVSHLRHASSGWQVNHVTHYMCMREERAFYARFFLENFVKFWEVSTIAKDQTQVNEKIRAKELRLIGQNGDQIGVKSKREALEMAEHVELDLVVVAPNAKPPVARIMDYGKYKFEQQKKKRKKKQKLSMLKKYA